MPPTTLNNKHKATPSKKKRIGYMNLDQIEPSRKTFNVAKRLSSSSSASSSSSSSSSAASVHPVLEKMTKKKPSPMFGGKLPNQNHHGSTSTGSSRVPNPKSKLKKKRTSSESLDRSPAMVVDRNNIMIGSVAKKARNDLNNNNSSNNNSSHNNSDNNVAVITDHDGTSHTPLKVMTARPRTQNKKGERATTIASTKTKTSSSKDFTAGHVPAGGARRESGGGGWGRVSIDNGSVHVGKEPRGGDVVSVRSNNGSVGRNENTTTATAIVSAASTMAGTTSTSSSSSPSSSSSSYEADAVGQSGRGNDTGHNDVLGDGDDDRTTHNNDGDRPTLDGGTAETAIRIKQEDDDGLDDDDNNIELTLLPTRELLREELCKLVSKDSYVGSRRNAIRTLQLCVQQNDDIKQGKALEQVQNLFLLVGGPDSILSFMDSFCQGTRQSLLKHDAIDSIGMAATILLACCSDASYSPKKKKKKPLTMPAPGVQLCVQVVNCAGIRILLEIIRRLNHTADAPTTTREEIHLVAFALEQIWATLSNICSENFCLALMEKKLQLEIIELALVGVQSIGKLRNEDEGTTHRERILRAAQNNLTTIDNLCDNPTTGEKSKIKLDDFRRLRMLPIILNSITDSYMVQEQKWDHPAFDLLNWFLTAVNRTFRENGWLDDGNLCSMSDLMDKLISNLSSEMYKEFGEELFDLLEFTVKTVPRGTTKTSCIPNGLTRILSNPFAPPVATTKAEQLLKIIFA